jgi:hypothetical protein
MLKLLKLSKLAKRLGMSTTRRKVSRDSWTSIPGRILGGQPIFLAICGQIRGSHSLRNAEIPGSLNGIIESKKSAEWWNVINDRNREWTESPKDQES